MDKDTMRKRGWSIQSDQTSKEDENDAREEGEEDDLNQDEKKRLLESFPVENDESVPSDRQHDVTRNSMDGPRKRKEATKAENTGTLVDPKSKLSKWAARLFDPDRPRGVTQPPQTIPLNDEFLTAFGKREKEYDEKLGRSIDIENKISDQDATKDADANNTASAIDLTVDTKPPTPAPEETRKVKITNLLFTMSQDTLRAACETFGPLEEVNLIMDRDQPNRNSGRAYVTFETIDGANACVEKLETLGGRKLRVSLAADTPKRSRKSAGGGGAMSMPRYWDKDITTKCFRCGRVGHMEASCPNEAKQKPCPLCALPGHDMRSCAISRICFRCGVPGHINRDCVYKQNLPKRMVCGICFQSGHHRTNCRRRAVDAPSQHAKCMVCHKVGHFLCTDLKWFFGLEGVSCFNCGRSGHHGYDCNRPVVDVCGRDEGVAQREIERAMADSLADELTRQRQSRGRTESRNQDRSRAKSQGPPRAGGEYRGRGYAVGPPNGPNPNKRKGDSGGNNRNQKRRR